jgi:hypothetical protein
MMLTDDDEDAVFIISCCCFCFCFCLSIVSTPHTSETQSREEI